MPRFNEFESGLFRIWFFVVFAFWSHSGVFGAIYDYSLGPLHWCQEDLQVYTCWGCKLHVQLWLRPLAYLFGPYTDYLNTLEVIKDLGRDLSGCRARPCFTNLELNYDWGGLWDQDQVNASVSVRFWDTFWSLSSEAQYRKTQSTKTAESLSVGGSTCKQGDSHPVITSHDHIGSRGQTPHILHSHISWVMTATCRVVSAASPLVPRLAAWRSTALYLSNLRKQISEYRTLLSTTMLDALGIAWVREGERDP